MNIKNKVRSAKCGVLGALVAVGLSAFAADPSVTVGEVTAGEPWSTITVNYTLGGVDAATDYKVAFDITAGGQIASVTNDATKLTDGAATKEINTVEIFGKEVVDTKAKVKVSLIAIKPKPLPVGALKGVFSVSATKKVYFSKGNLWYGKVGDAQTATFQFEANQYEFHGYDSANNTWGLFGWVGASSTFTSSPEIYGVSTSTTYTDYGNSVTEALKADWGKAIDDKGTWSTLSKDEWKYLINKDGDENIRKGKYKYGVTVCEKANCLILAPDDFEGTIAESYDAAAWATAEAAGLVCLPAAGYRNGSDVNSVGSGGRYWSSSAFNLRNAYRVESKSDSVTPDSYGTRSNGFSVRLVTEVK